MDLRLLALACLGLVVLSACGSPAGSPSRLSGDPAPPPPPAQAAASLCRKVSRGPGVAGRLVAGLTHTQYSADPGGDSRAVAGARSVLSGTGNCLQNQYVMGFGADNPEPSPGVFNFSTLDARLALIRQTGGTPVITLCCSPDWMKGGDAGTTDWSRIDAAPLPEHFADFATLARTVAQRYPDVRHYQVWSELKGFWSASLNRWDYEGYATLYNLVHDTLKSVNPAIQVGGPYVVMDSEADPALMSNPSEVRGAWGTLDQRVLDVVTYWLGHSHGADFLSVDAGTTSRDGELVTDEFTATQKLADLTSWLRSRSSLPVWWSEWYVVPRAAAGWSDAHKAAVVAEALAQMASAGSAAALLWQPQGDGTGCPLACLWTDTRKPGGGEATDLAKLWPSLAQWLAAPGHRVVPAVPSTVKVFGGGDLLLSVNTTDQPATAVAGGVTIELPAYGVVVRDPSQDRAR